MSIYRGPKESSVKFISMRKEAAKERETDYMYRDFGSNVTGQGDRPDRDPIFRVVPGYEATADKTPKKPVTKSFKAKNSK